MTDLATLGGADTPGLAHTEGGEIVVQQERVSALALQRVDDLRIAFGAERRHDQRLRLASRELGRAVRARQDSGANAKRTYRLRVPAVDAGFAVENSLPHQALFDVLDCPFDGLYVRSRTVLRRQRRDDLLTDLEQTILPALLLDDPVGVGNGGARLRRNALGDPNVLLRRFPAPTRFARLGAELTDRPYGNLHLLVTKHYRPEHLLLREDFGFRLHHQHG